jgi:hypothetical protein
MTRLSLGRISPRHHGAFKSVAVAESLSRQSVYQAPWHELCFVGSAWKGRTRGESLPALAFIGPSSEHPPILEPSRSSFCMAFTILTLHGEG